MNTTEIPVLPASLKPSDLPTPPKVAMDVMRACSRDDCSSTKLGALAARDAVLTAAVLRVVNSAWYGFTQEISTVTHAAAILGQRALRNLVLCITVRDVLSGVQIDHFDRILFSEDALRRAVAAQLLARKTTVDADEAFTAGLLQDFGLFVLYFLYPTVAVHWGELRQANPEHRLKLETDLFPIGHDQIGGQIAEQWQLPQGLADAIQRHHQPMSDNVSLMTKILHCADWLAAVYEVDDTGGCVSRCQELLDDVLGLDQEHVEECLEQLPQQLSVRAREMALPAGEQRSLTELMRDTNAVLAEENLSYQELTLRLQHTVRERDRLAAELEQELELAREIQCALLPTTMPVTFPICGINVSAKQLSGDFYDYFELSDSRLFFCVGDVSGKGTNAAILMAKALSLCRCLARRLVPLQELVETVNREIVDTSTRGMFVTLACGILSPDGTLEFVSAGHLPALVLRPNVKPILLNATGPPLGVLEDTVYPPTHCNVRRMRMYLFSDGITECPAQDKRELGIAGLLKLLLATWTQPPMQQLEVVVQSLLESTGAAKDDLTLLRLSLDG